MGGAENASDARGARSGDARGARSAEAPGEAAGAAPQAPARRAGACGAAPLGAGDGPKILAADVGTGTADILVTLPGEPLENAVRLVVPSRTQVVARQIRAATAARRPVVFVGPVMGGGPDGAAMKAHVAAGLPFIAGESAALTFDDDLDKVRARGVKVVGDAEAATLAAEAIAAEASDPVGTSGPARASDIPATGEIPATGDASWDARPVVVRSGDLDVEGLRRVLQRLGVSPCFDAVCVAVQDHGFTPRGSNRAARFAFWEQALSDRRPLADLFWPADDVPATFTRLRAATALAAELGDGAPVLAADTGPAALYGAMPESGDAVLVNAGNGHTVCVVARDGRLAGVFEHHTSALDGPALERFLRRFLAGELTSAEVREDGGHGAVLAPGALDGLAAPILVTGPRRDLLRDSALALEFAAPHGDMMLTGCYGLLRAAGERGLAGRRRGGTS